MNSLRSHEGYLLIDHRGSPGVPDELMVPQGYIPGAGHGKFESATFTCPYCEFVVVLNPDRSRPRNFDKKTQHLICDGCEHKIKVLGLDLKPMKQIADELRNEAAKTPQSEVFQSPVLIGVK